MYVRILVFTHRVSFSRTSLTHGYLSMYLIISIQPRSQAPAATQSTNPFPLIKDPPPQIINSPEVFIIRGSFLANVLKTKNF